MEQVKAQQVQMRLDAIDTLLEEIRDIVFPAPQPVDDKAPPMAWGGRVSQVFRDRVHWIAQDLFSYKGAADDVMTCIAWETGRTFSPSVKNLAGSGATGLIQFMPKTARESLDTTVEALAQMSAEDQLNYVWKYLEPFKGEVQNLGDLYMTILWPKAVGKPDDYVLWSGGTIAYRQNAGLDANKDRRVTKAECAAKLYAMRAEGLRPENYG